MSSPSQMLAIQNADAAAADGAAVIEAVHRLGEALQEESRLPGLAIAVGRGGDIVYSEAFGVADLETGAPASPSTRWRIGSISKSLTAAGAVLLSERGALGLDATVGDLLPGWRNRPAAKVTARQLAGHLGGIRHYREGEGIRHVHYDDVIDALEIFAADSLEAPPGTDYGYSTYGYVLLSALMQQTAGMPYLDWMHRAVFQPVGLRHTGPDLVTEVVPGRASFYEIEDGRLRPAPSGDDSYKWAGGGLLSTPEDLVRFGGALLAGRLVSPAGVQRLLTSQRTAEGAETGYGMGFRPDRDGGDRRIAHHGGSSSGARAFLLLYPEDDIVVAMAANRATAPLFEEEAAGLAHFFLEHVGDTASHAPQIDRELVGRWHAAGTLGDDPVGGTLLLFSGITARGLFDWREGAAPVRIVVADRHDDELQLFGVGPHGLMRAWLEPVPDGWSGAWEYLGSRGQIELSKLGSVATDDDTTGVR